MRPRRAIAASVVLLLVAGTVLAPPATGAVGSVDPRTFGELWRYSRDPENGTLWSVCWSPDGSMVAGAFFDNHVLVLNSTTGEVVVDLLARPDDGRCDGYAPPGLLPTRTVSWSPDGRWLAAAGDDRVVFVYDTGTWEVHRSLVGHKGSVQCLDWSNDGTRLASGSGRDKVVPNGIGENVTYIWDVESATVLMRLEGHTDGVLGVAWSPDDARIATASDDRTARVWDPATGEEVARLEGHTSGTLDCAWSPNGTLLVTGSRDYKARLWHVGENRSLGRWADYNCVRSVDWHPAGDIIATSGVDKTLKFRNSTTGNIQWTIEDGDDIDSIVMKSRWSPLGDRIVCAYGKAATVIMYGDVGRQVDGDEGEPVLTAMAVLAVTVIGCALIFYPAMVKIRRRRG